MLSYERRHLVDTLWFHKRDSGGDACMPGCARNLEVNIDEAFSQGAAPTTLHTYTLQPTNGLRTNRSFLDIWYAGSYAANANSKVLSAVAGGTTYEVSAGIQPGTSGWAMAVRITRITSTSILVSDIFSINSLFASNATPAVPTSFGESSFFATRNRLITPIPSLDLNPLVLSVVGQGVANNDILQNLSIINITRV